MFFNNSKRSSSTLTRRILSVMSIFGSVEALGMLCSVVRTKLVALWLGSAGIGLLGLFNTVIELLGSASQLGVRTSAVRHIAATTDSRRQQVIRLVMSYGRYLALAGVLLTIILSPLLSYITFGNDSQTYSFMMLAAAVGCNTLIATRSAVLQGSGQLKVLAQASIIATITSLVFAIPCIYFLRMNGIIPLLLTYNVVTLAVYIVFGKTPNKGELVKLPYDESRAMVKSMLKLGIYLSLSGASGWLASYVIMSFLHSTGGESIMGLYQSGYTISTKYIGVVFTALSLEYFPRLTAAFEGGLKRGSTMLRHETLLSIAVITAVSALMIPGAPLLLKLLYNDSFLEIVPMIVLATPGIILKAVSWTMGYVILAKGRGKLYLISEITSCIVCIATTCISYSMFDIPGLGIAFSLWYLIYTMVLWYIIQHYIKIRPGRKVAIVSISATILTAIVAVAHTFIPGWWSLVAAAMLAISALVFLRKLA